MAEGNEPQGSGVEVTIVCFAAILVAVCIYVGVVVANQVGFGAVDISNIIRNYGLLALGTVGLPLAIWRSWVAHLQTQEAIAQGKRVERQIQAAEINNLTTLFDKAASLLSDASNEKKRAGIALLRHIGMSPVGSLGQEALDLLADYLKKGGTTPFNDQTSATALKYADHIAQALNVKLRFEIIFTSMEILYLPSNVFGVIYSNCSVNNQTIGRAGRYENCQFMNCVIESGSNFKGDNHFLECEIKAISLNPNSRSSFSYCDFSNCSRANHVETHMLKDCYFLRGGKPTKKVFDRIGSHLENHDDDI